jgi:hypothetical protein
MRKPHQERMIIMVDAPLFYDFERIIEKQKTTKAAIIRGFLESFVQEEESHPTGRYFNVIKTKRKANGSRKSLLKA